VCCHRTLKNLLYFLYKLNDLFRKFNIDFNVKKNWLIKAKPYAQKLALEADAVISTFGPEESHLLAYEMKINNKNLLWVADYRDFWSNPYTAAKKNFVKKIEIETVGSHADIVTAVSNCLVREIHLMLNKKALPTYSSPYETV
jgi:hypothetical protein